MPDEKPPTSQLPAVFISYAAADDAIARRLRQALAESGITVFSEPDSIAPGSSTGRLMPDSISAHDFVILLLSRHFREADTFESELELAQSVELENRSIELLPVLIESGEVPLSLRRWQAVNLTDNFPQGVEEIIERIAGTTALDLLELDAANFEQMVVALLGTYFDDIPLRPPSGPDGGYDFAATSLAEDPFGRVEEEIWYIEVKRYGSRISLDQLAQFVSTVQRQPRRGRGLLVTNARLTSVARSFLADIAEKAKTEMRVIEGPELKRLLASNPRIRATYFPLRDKP